MTRDSKSRDFFLCHSGADKAGIVRPLSEELKKRGCKAAKRNPLLPELDQLRKENERLAQCLKQAELIIEVQKKVSQVLEIPLEPPKSSEGD